MMHRSNAVPPLRLSTLCALMLAACAPVDPGSDPVGGETDPGGDVGALGAFEGDPRLQADALFVHLEALSQAAEAHGGHRSVGSDGYDASVDWVEGWVRDLGFDPVREPFEVRDWSAVSASVSQGDLAPSDGVAPLTWSPGGTATGSLVRIDVVDPPPAAANGSTSGCEASDFEGMAAGSIALIQRGTCTFTDKALNAQAAGAVAVLVFNEGQAGRTGVVEGALGPEDGLTIPVLGLSHADGLALTEGTAVTVQVSVRDEGIPSTNVLVDIPGTDPRGVWVVGAHLDSVPAGPGINDNGTGVALLLQLAEILADEGPRRDTVRLAWWGAEEVGLVGSLHHVGGLAEDAPILGNLNFDMIGSPNPAHFVYDGDGSTFGVPEGLPSPADNAVIEAAFEAGFAARGMATDPVPYDGRSDYLGFALAGWPTGGLFTGAESIMSDAEADRYGGEAGEAFDACYHRDCDALDNVDRAVLTTMAEVSAEVLFEQADDPGGDRRARPWQPEPAEIPTWAPRSCHHGASQVR